MLFFIEIPNLVLIGYLNLIWRWTNFRQTKPYTDLNDKQIKIWEKKTQSGLEEIQNHRHDMRISHCQRSRLNANNRAEQGAKCNLVDDQFVPNQTVSLAVVLPMTREFTECQFSSNNQHIANEMKNTESRFYQFIRRLSPDVSIYYFSSLLSSFFFRTFFFLHAYLF